MKITYFKTFKLIFLQFFFVFSISNQLSADDCTDSAAPFFKDNNPESDISKIADNSILRNIVHQHFPEQNITPEEAFAMVTSYRNNPNFVILDVRTFAEFDTFHIKGAMNLDFKAKDFRSKISQLLDRSKIYLIHCASGMRAQKALSVMNQLGLEHTYNINGGINAWDDLKLPTEF